jgi:hypothetical protein
VKNIKLDSQDAMNHEVLWICAKEKRGDEKMGEVRMFLVSDIQKESERSPRIEGEFKCQAFWLIEEG